MLDQNLAHLAEAQELLYPDGRYSLLVVLRVTPEQEKLLDEGRAGLARE